MIAKEAKKNVANKSSRLSQKLVLGTVQFGMDYGINNPNGKPSLEKSLSILDFAFNNGINFFDTAYAYGEAEEILGKFSESRKLGKKIKITTKLKPNILSESKSDTSKIIKDNLAESLRRLQREYVDGYLLHTPAYVRNNDVIKTLVELKKDGLVKKIGVSIYEEDDAVYAAKLPEVDYIQIPYSVFDQRLNKTDFFKIAKKNKKTIFARSAFIQGLLFMPEKKIPQYLEIAKSYFRKFDEIIGKYGLTRQEAALLFSCKNESIDYVVFGVDNIKQLKENIEICGKNFDCGDCIKELQKAFSNVGKSIIMPSLWKK